MYVTIDVCESTLTSLSEPFIKNIRFKKFNIVLTLTASTLLSLQVNIVYIVRWTYIVSGSRRLKKALYGIFVSRLALRNLKNKKKKRLETTIPWPKTSINLKN